MSEKNKSKKPAASTARSSAKPKAKAKTSAPAPKKGKSASAQQRASGKRQKTLSNEIKGILLIAVGIFLSCAFLTEATGAVGSFIRNLCYGLFGFSIAISCIFIIITGTKVFMDKAGEKNGFRLILLSLLIISTSVLVTLFFGGAELVGNSLAENTSILWHSGTEEGCGGIIGGGLHLLLTSLIGTAGAWVLTLAAELILIILLTGVSLEGLFRSIAGVFKRHRNDYEEIADSEVDFELPEYSVQSEKVKKKLADRKNNGSNSKKKRDGDFFDGYFDGKETIDDTEDNPSNENDGIDADIIPKRFEFKEDDKLFDDIFPASKDDFSDTAELPFTLDNLKTGVLTELPDENGNLNTPAENEEGTDFEPPSEAKLEDVFDPLTQKAVDAGIELDRAVLAGRRMATEEAEEQTPEAEIRNQIEESAPPRIIQYYLPTADLLEMPKPQSKTREELKAELEDKANRLLETLASFKVEATIINITQGPSVTRFELQPGFGVKVSKITNLADDIALSLAASGVRIEPVPGKSAIGIEIPNKTPTAVPIREVISSDKFKNFKSKTAFALGKDISGNCVVADIADFPHGLIAGATGSGKSVCINSLITSILFKARPDEVKMIMVDPKMVELGVYNGIPHLLIPVVTDPKHAAGALNWAVGEMKNRYALLKDNKVRNLKGYNKLMDEIGEPDAKLPEIVIIIDELADLMMAAKNEVESAINSLAALARAAGMYLIIATQRPSVNVVTGVIKNNIPTRIAFAVTSNVDSRTILDSVGAEKLLGKGDMLYSPRGAAKPIRIQGNFVSDREIEAIIDFIKSQYEAAYDESIIENIEREREQVAANISSQEADDDDERDSGQRDKLFWEAVELILENGQASVAMFQRKFKIGYQRAARLIDQMERYKIIGPYEGTKPRAVLITRQEFTEMRMNNPE